MNSSRISVRISDGELVLRILLSNSLLYVRMTSPAHAAIPAGCADRHFVIHMLGNAKGSIHAFRDQNSHDMSADNA